MITPPILAASVWPGGANVDTADVRSWAGWVETKVFSGKVTAKSVGFTVLEADRTDIFRCTAGLTVALTSAATLGNGFAFGVIADGGDVVIDPAASETVNGTTTLTVSDGNACAVYSDGTNWQAIVTQSQQNVEDYVDAHGIVQVVRAETNALTTIVETPFPLDDTIPQQTEGTQLLTLAITPTSASNKLRIRATIHAGINTGTDMMMGLFQDSTSDALAAVGLEAQTSGSNLRPSTMILDHYMTAGTTSETIFKIRVGSAATLYINGAGGARLFGGAMVSSLTIEEIKA